MFCFALGKTISKYCSKVEFPLHQQARFRRPCNTKLMKTVISMNGNKSYLYPYKVYSCRSIQKSLEQMLCRPGFIDLLEKPKNLNMSGMTDMYDGRISFLDSNGANYFDNKRNLGVLSNVDWFNPFKRTEYSMGVLYLVIVNLPRAHRFKWENVIVLGVIPGPKEPSKTINSFLRHHVEELLNFWEGVVLSENGNPCLYKMALLGCSNDIPATRKCCGFMAHNAHKGIYRVFQKKYFFEQKILLLKEYFFEIPCISK